MKVWDYQTKTCIQTLAGHEDNVSAVRFHPRLPYILSCGEDGRVLVFHSGSYRKERVLLQPALDRCWAVALSEHGNTVVLGYDEGYCCYALGKAAPPVSMDLQGRLIWARRQELWLSVCEARTGGFWRSWARASTWCTRVASCAARRSARAPTSCGAPTATRTACRSFG